MLLLIVRYFNCGNQTAIYHNCGQCQGSLSHINNNNVRLKMCPLTGLVLCNWKGTVSISISLKILFRRFYPSWNEVTDTLNLWIQGNKLNNLTVRSLIPNESDIISCARSGEAWTYNINHMYIDWIFLLLFIYLEKYLYIQSKPVTVNSWQPHL